MIDREGRGNGQIVCPVGPLLGKVQYVLFIYNHIPQRSFNEQKRKTMRVIRSFFSSAGSQNNPFPSLLFTSYFLSATLSALSLPPSSSFVLPFPFSSSRLSSPNAPPPPLSPFFLRTSFFLSISIRTELNRNKYMVLLLFFVYSIQRLLLHKATSRMSSGSGDQTPLQIESPSILQAPSSPSILFTQTPI